MTVPLNLLYSSSNIDKTETCYLKVKVVHFFCYFVDSLAKIKTQMKMY